MPLYEYRCPKCGQDFEKLARASEADKPVKCPNCGEEGAERQVSLFGGLFGGCGSPSGGFGGG